MQYCVSCDRPIHLRRGDMTVFCQDCINRHEDDEKTMRMATAPVNPVKDKLEEAELAIEYWRRRAKEAEAKLNEAQDRALSFAIGYYELKTAK